MCVILIIYILSTYINIFFLFNNSDYNNVELILDLNFSIFPNLTVRYTFMSYTVFYLTLMVYVNYIFRVNKHFKLSLNFLTKID